MGWQEELRRLDVDLAEGRITHETHRKQRDDLLAGASGGVAPSPLTSPLRRPTEPMWHSVDPGPQAPPPSPVPPPPPVKPPPFKPAAPFVTNRRTTAPSPADQRATDSLPYPRPTQSRVDAATVVRPAVLPPPPPPLPGILDAARQPGPVQQYLDQPHPDPAADHPTGSKSAWLFVGAGLLLVVALIGGGSWWLLGGGSGGASQAAPPVPLSSSPAPAPTPTPTPQPGPPIADRVAAPPGVPNKDNSTMSIAKGAELGLYPAEAAGKFTANGATEIAYRASTDGAGPDAYFILVLPTKSPANAKAIVDYLGNGSLSGGFDKTADSRLTVAGVRDGRAMTGSWYASGNIAVTLWVSQPADTKRSALNPKFTTMLSALQQKLPAG
jgi:hypothetical protein